MDIQFLLFVLVGFIAQLIDGSLGMAYGVSANSFLLGVGVSPAAASASVHTAEIVTTAVSGLSHWRFGNVDFNLVKRLAIPGVIGGVTGAYILTSLPGEKLKPYIAIYLLIMGIRIFLKALKFTTLTTTPKNKYLFPLGLFGGLFDAIGGGGWGPIVTSTLISDGNVPNKTIGSVNLTEFFVTFSEAIAFILTIGLVNLNIILGLMLGGVIAAPFGALLTKKLPPKVIMIIVAVLIIGLQLRTLYQIWF
ncbi:MAG: hypothetical protein CL609_09255 [Anaerolineaceae bacterium]|nr:hypothetical protein [Anaerolineaceae bacterium]